MFFLGSQSDVSLETHNHGTHRKKLHLGGGTVEWQLDGAPRCWLDKYSVLVSIHQAFEKLGKFQVVYPG